jgi:hypothetical protein
MLVLLRLFTSKPLFVVIIAKNALIIRREIHDSTGERGSEHGSYIFEPRVRVVCGENSYCIIGLRNMSYNIVAGWNELVWNGYEYKISTLFYWL